MLSAASGTVEEVSEGSWRDSTVRVCSGQRADSGELLASFWWQPPAAGLRSTLSTFGGVEGGGVSDFGRGELGRRALAVSTGPRAHANTRRVDPPRREHAGTQLQATAGGQLGGEGEGELWWRGLHTGTFGWGFGRRESFLPFRQQAASSQNPERSSNGSSNPPAPPPFYGLPAAAAPALIASSQRLEEGALCSVAHAPG